MRKGQQDFITVVSDIDRKVLLEVIDSHQQIDIIEVLMQQPFEVRQAVEEVSVDMWGGFPKVIAQVYPNASLVFDRFHVMKAVIQELNKIRWKIGIKDRGSKYLLFRNQADLNEQQQQKLARVLEKSECLRIAYQLKEEFRDIYETSKPVKTGRRKLEKWLKTAQPFYGNSAQTIWNHFDGICNYFRNRTTSGVMEGINNRMKLIMRQGYGFSNFENFRSRLLACLGD
jgi:transposase